MNKGSTCRPSTPSSHGSLHPLYLVQPLCTPSPLVGAWTTSTPWLPGLRHPLTRPRILNLLLKAPSPALLRPAFVHPPPLVFAWAMLTPSLVKHPAPLNASCGASWRAGVTSASCHPPPFINASCGASQCAGVLAALTVTSPSYRICDGPPTPPPPGLALAPQVCYPIASPAWWPGASALGFGHLPRCPDLVVWALACTYHALVV